MCVSVINEVKDDKCCHCCDNFILWVGYSLLRIEWELSLNHSSFLWLYCWMMKNVPSHKQHPPTSIYETQRKYWMVWTLYLNWMAVRLTLWIGTIIIWNKIICHPLLFLHTGDWEEIYKIINPTISQLNTILHNILQ